MYHLVGEASRCPNTICNTVSRRYYENVKREQTPGQKEHGESPTFKKEEKFTKELTRNYQRGKRKSGVS